MAAASFARRCNRMFRKLCRPDTSQISRTLRNYNGRCGQRRFKRTRKSCKRRTLRESAKTGLATKNVSIMKRLIRHVIEGRRCRQRAGVVGLRRTAMWRKTRRLAGEGCRRALCTIRGSSVRPTPARKGSSGAPGPRPEVRGWGRHGRVDGLRPKCFVSETSGGMLSMLLRV